MTSDSNERAGMKNNQGEKQKHQVANESVIH